VRGETVATTLHPQECLHEPLSRCVR
jgi:hypothetical protein